MGSSGSGGRGRRIIGGLCLAVVILLITSQLAQATLISPTLDSVFKFPAITHKQLDYSYFAEHPPVLSLDEKSVLVLSTLSLQLFIFDHIERLQHHFNELFTVFSSFTRPILLV